MPLFSRQKVGGGHRWEGQEVPNKQQVPPKWGHFRGVIGSVSQSSGGSFVRPFPFSEREKQDLGGHVVGQASV